MRDRECRCGKPLHNQAVVCSDCADALGRALGEVPALEDELNLTLSRQRRFGEGNGGSRTSETPSPYHLKASEVIGNLRAILVAWVRLCDEEKVRHADHRPLDPAWRVPFVWPGDYFPKNTLTDMSGWLLWRVDGLMTHPAGDDAVEEIIEAVRACHYVIDRPADRIYVGPCECGRDVYAKVGRDEGTCPACERTYDVEAMRTWMKSQIYGRLVTAREGAGLLSRFDLETKQGTIDKWVERKRLTVRGHDQDGRRLYLFDDLVELAASNTPQHAG